MYLEGRTRLRLGTAANRLCRWLAVLFPFSIIGSVFGQGYLVPPPGFQGAPSAPTMGNVSGNTGAVNGQPIGGMNGEAVGTVPGQANGEAGQTGTEGQSSGTAGAPLVAPISNLMQWGALHLHAHAGYQFLYGSGIHSQPGKSTDTFTHTLTPGLSLTVGPHVSLGYSAAIRFYSERDFHNTVDHSATLSAGAAYGDWTFGVSQSFSISDEPLVQTSSQTQQKDYSAGLTASYEANDKLTLTTTAGAALLYVGGNNTSIVRTNDSGEPVPPPQSQLPLSDSQSYSAGETLLYDFDEKLSGGFGVTVDYSEQSGGFKSVDEQYQGHVNWHPGAKLSALLSGGFEHQQFLNSNAQDAWNPIFSAMVGYQLFKPTSLSLSANRSVSSSLFQNQIMESTALGIGLQQRFLGKLELALGFGYTISDYKVTTANLATARSDSGTSFSAALSFPFLTRCGFAAFYEFSQNTSSQGGFGYSSDQVGMTLSWAY
jgi:hypothetical protein